MTHINSVIKVTNLGKKYKIGKQKEKYYTFRDAFSNLIIKPLKGRSSLHSISEELWALKNITFEINQGEVVGIIGRNGAGKSTLLKILSRITPPSEGKIELHGRIGSLLEVGTGFHPEFTGRENIFLSGSILGMQRSEIDSKLDEIVKFSEIEKFLDTPVKRYSSGMYVRLAFAVAAHLETEILLVDEVLAVGDAVFQKKCLGKMGDVAKEERTVLFVSHNMNAINNLTDHCIWIDGGNIKMQGDSREIVSNYLEEGYQVTRTWKTELINNNPIQILSAEISNKSGFFTVSEDIYIKIRYVVREVVFNSVISLIIHSSDGASILGTEDIDKNPHLLEKRYPGEYCTELTIPGNWLSPGKYYVRLHSGIVYQVVFDNIEAMCFELTETGDHRIRSHKKAYLLPYLDWKTIRLQ